MKKEKILLAVIILALLCGASYCNAKIGIVPSYDGQLISYNVFGNGQTTLVFVHGWGGDGRYWRYQVPYFFKKYRIVTIDLAGHGNSECDYRRRLAPGESSGLDQKDVAWVPGKKSGPYETANCVRAGYQGESYRKPE